MDLRWREQGSGRGKVYYLCATKTMRWGISDHIVARIKRNRGSGKWVVTYPDRPNSAGFDDKATAKAMALITVRMES